MIAQRLSKRAAVDRVSDCARGTRRAINNQLADFPQRATNLLIALPDQ
jgi:hypothetical protein